MIKQEDFKQRIIKDGHWDLTATITDQDANFLEVNTEKAAAATYELAKQMAIEFAEWARKNRSEYDYKISNEDLFTEWQKTQP